MEHWIWLSLALGAGSAKVNDVVTQFETAADFYAERANGFSSVDFLTKTEKDKLSAASLDDAKRIMEQTLSRGYEILTPQMPAYPNRLRNIYGMPAVLYLHGKLGAIDENVAVALVGTRKRSEYGAQAANKLGYELAKSGAIVLSGLARGIDTDALSGALRAGGMTVAVLGCGLDTAYPPENAKMQEFIGTSGAVLTEYPLGSRPEGFHFPVRNRLISGLSLGVVVVEADLGSGALITANHALEQGKDVFTVPNSIFTPLSKGSFRLLRMGAIPVSCGADILEEYRYRYASKIKTEKPAEFESPGEKPRAKKQEAPSVIKEKKPLPEGEEALFYEIYDLLSEVPVHLDEIVAKTQKNPAEVLTALSELEIMGFVSVVAGKRYRTA